MTSELTPSQQRHTVIKAAKIIVGIALFVAVVVIARNIYNDAVHADDVVRILGGPEIVEILAHPDRVTAQRVGWLEFDEMPDLDNSGFNIINYQTLGEPVEVSGSRARSLPNWLTSGSSYIWPDNFAKSCVPTYGVKLTFYRGEKHLDVWLCFECDIFVVMEDIEYEHPRDASGGGNFDLIHNELAGIMQALFPDDEAIQAL